MSRDGRASARLSCGVPAPRLVVVLVVEQRWTPPGSDQAAGRLHVVQAGERRGRRRVVDGRGRVDAARQLGLAVLLGVAARVGAALLAAAAVVRLHVLGQVVGAHEALVTHGAGESLLAGVRA